MTKVLVVEDHRLVAQGLELGLEAEGFDVLLTPGDLDVAKRDIVEFDPDIVILDINLGSHGNGLDLLPEIAVPGRYVVVLTGEPEPVTLARAFDSGATAVLDKAMPFMSLVAELRQVVNGGSQAAERKRREIGRTVRKLKAEQATRLRPFMELTPRETEVLSMLIDGRQAAEIAELSYVSLSTVRTQIRGILTKLGVSSQLAAVSMAIKSGWSDPHRNQQD